MATVKFYLDTRRAKKDGTFPLKLNVFHRGQILISTKFSSSKRNWTGVEYTNKEPNYRTKNVAIQNIMNRVENLIFRLSERGEIDRMTDRQLKSIIDIELNGDRKNAQYRSLTVEQLRILRDYPCEDYQEKYRDMFMLMFYLVGINAADLFLAKKTDIVNGRLEYKRAKTGKLYSIKIEPEAQEIIDRYSGNEENGYLLNVMDSYSNYKDFLHRMGVGLKQIGEMERKGLGGKKIIQPLFPDLSSYWSRNTWATIAASLDIPKEIIACALGHSWTDSTITNICIFNEKKIDDANRKVINYVLE